MSIYIVRSLHLRISPSGKDGFYCRYDAVALCSTVYGLSAPQVMAPVRNSQPSMYIAPEICGSSI